MSSFKKLLLTPSVSGFELFKNQIYVSYEIFQIEILIKWENWNFISLYKLMGEILPKDNPTAGIWTAAGIHRMDGLNAFKWMKHLVLERDMVKFYNFGQLSC